MITIAETDPFHSKSTALLSAEEKDDLIAYLSEHPNSGDLIQGSGDIRKIRWSRGNRGKSGGVRVIYYFHSEINAAVFDSHFRKNEKANI